MLEAICPRLDHLPGKDPDTRSLKCDVGTLLLWKAARVLFTCANSDITCLQFAHPGEKARRRDPKQFTYAGIACPDMKKVRLALRDRLALKTAA